MIRVAGSVQAKFAKCSHWFFANIFLFYINALTGCSAARKSERALTNCGRERPGIQRQPLGLPATQNRFS